MWHELIDEIDFERRQLRRLIETYAELIAGCQANCPTVAEKAALAAILHSFYTGVENIFKRVAIALDGGSPQGSFWHSDLIKSMSCACRVLANKEKVWYISL